MSSEINDPFAGITPLGEQAGQLHEVYKEQVEAGFTSVQSIYLVGCILTGSPGPAPDDSVTPPE